jgi:hypothetical protein
MDNSDNKIENAESSDISVGQYIRDEGYIDETGCIRTEHASYELDFFNEGEGDDFRDVLTFNEILSMERMNNADFQSYVNIAKCYEDISSNEGRTKYELAMVIASMHDLKYVNEEPQFFITDVNKEAIDNLVKAVRLYDEILYSENINNITKVVEVKITEVNDFIDKKIKKIIEELKNK